MTKAIIKEGSPQAKKFVAAYACKSAVVKSCPPAFFSHVAKNPYTLYVYLKNSNNIPKGTKKEE